MSSPKNHHYIPRNHLNRFIDEEGKLWVFDMKRGRELKHRPVKKIFSISNHNTIYGPELERDVSYETRMAHYEGVFKTTVDFIIDSISESKKPSIDRDFFDEYFLIQLRRSPEFEEKVQSAGEVVPGVYFKSIFNRYGEARELEAFQRLLRGKGNFDSEQEGLVREYGKKRGLTLSESDFDKARTTKLIARQFRKAIVMSRYGLSDKELACLKNFDLNFIDLPSDRMQFVIGSVAVIDTSIIQPKSQFSGLFLALTPNLAAIYAPNNNVVVSDPRIIQKIVRKINIITANQSSVFASGNKALMSSLTRRITHSSQISDHAPLKSANAKRLA